MADYDVAAVSLDTPPRASVLTPYRPAVLVANLGVHDALASGYVKIYDAADLLIFESEVYSNTIAPGDSGLAQASDIWTPPAEGNYVIFGYVTCPLDQVEPNNNLAPVTITVKGGPVPPPPVVTAHAPQHESGGTDEVSVEGLKGLLHDQQNPRSHVSTHQVGGSDALNVDSLLGQLAQDQPALTHDNSRHNPTMATSTQLTSHENATTAHSSAANLANRETSGSAAGYVTPTQLASSTEVPDAGDDPEKAGLRLGHTYGPVNAVHHAAKHAYGGLDSLGMGTELPPDDRECLLKTGMWGYPKPTTHASTHAPASTDPVAVPTVLSEAVGTVNLTNSSSKTTLISKSFSAANTKHGLTIVAQSDGQLSIGTGAGQTCAVKLDYIWGSTTVNLLTQLITLAANKVYSLEIRTIAGIDASGNWQATGSLVLTDTSSPTGDLHLVPFMAGTNPSQNQPGTLQLNVAPIGWAAGSTGTFPSSVMQGSTPA